MAHVISPVEVTVTVTWVPDPLVIVRHLSPVDEPVDDQLLEKVPPVAAQLVGAAPTWDAT
jgi:hypothetical protein